MCIVILAALIITDDKSYQSYRDGMMPILPRYSDGFGYDFKITETLRTETDAPHQQRVHHSFQIHSRFIEKILCVLCVSAVH